VKCNLGQDGDRARSLISTVWREAHSFDRIREVLYRDSPTYFLRCDVCRFYGRLDPRRAAARIGNSFEGAVYLTPDGVFPLAFRVNRARLSVVCIGCFFLPVSSAISAKKLRSA
jgi:hypothetical protein